MVYFGLSRAEAWGLTLGEYRDLDRAHARRAGEEYRRGTAWAWHAGHCAAMFAAGEPIPFRKYLDDMAPDPGDTPRDRLEREARERAARERALEVEMLFEVGRRERAATAGETDRTAEPTESEP